MVGLNVLDLHIVELSTVDSILFIYFACADLHSGAFYSYGLDVLNFIW